MRQHHSEGLGGASCQQQEERFHRRGRQSIQGCSVPRCSPKCLPVKCLLIFTLRLFPDSQLTQPLRGFKRQEASPVLGTCAWRRQRVGKSLDQVRPAERSFFRHHCWTVSPPGVSAGLARPPRHLDWSDGKGPRYRENLRNSRSPAVEWSGPRTGPQAGARRGEGNPGWHSGARTAYSQQALSWGSRSVPPAADRLPSCSSFSGNLLRMPAGFHLF